MRAAAGDRFHVRGNIVGQPEGRARSLRPAGGRGGREPPYLVRFDDGHPSLVFPGPDAVIEHPRKKDKKRPRKAGQRLRADTRRPARRKRAHAASPRLRKPPPEDPDAAGSQPV
jgi:hypothetical protein